MEKFGIFFQFFGFSFEISCKSIVYCLVANQK